MSPHSRNLTSQTRWKIYQFIDIYLPQKADVLRFLLFVFLALFPLCCFSEVKCLDLFDMPFTLATNFRPGPLDDPFLTFRANAGHYWTWLQTFKHPLFIERGVVSGDPHILNFDDVLLRSGRRDLVLTDFDDGAVDAPFYGDFLRLAISNQVSPYPVKLKTLIKAYISGLSGEEARLPKVLRRAQEASFKESKQSIEEYVEKNSKSKKLKLKSGMFRLQDADPTVTRIFARVDKPFADYLAERHYTIVDLAVRIKGEGGSQNLPRFMYLVEKDGELAIIEFKFSVGAAAGMMSSKALPHPAQRFTDLARHYSRSDLAPIVDWLTVGQYQFHVREKHPPLMEFDPKKIRVGEVRADAEEIYQYLAGLLGRAHGRQARGPAFLRRIQSQDDFVELSQKWVQSYIEDLGRLNAEAHSAMSSLFDAR